MLKENVGHRTQGGFHDKVVFKSCLNPLTLTKYFQLVGQWLWLSW